MITLNLMSFEKTYSKIDSELKDEFPKLFSLGELIAHNSELHKNYIVSEIVETTTKGTKFKYKQISNDSQKKDYNQKVNSLQLNLLGDELIEQISQYKEKNKTF